MLFFLPHAISCCEITDVSSAVVSVTAHKLYSIEEDCMRVSVGFRFNYVIEKQNGPIVATLCRESGDLLLSQIWMSISDCFVLYLSFFCKIGTIMPTLTTDNFVRCALKQFV